MSNRDSWNTYGVPHPDQKGWPNLSLGEKKKELKRFHENVEKAKKEHDRLIATPAGALEEIIKNADGSLNGYIEEDKTNHLGYMEKVFDYQHDIISEKREMKRVAVELLKIFPSETTKKTSPKKYINLGDIYQIIRARIRIGKAREGINPMDPVPEGKVILDTAEIMEIARYLNDMETTSE